MVAKRGIAVFSGSGNAIHKFIDDGSSQIGSNSEHTCSVQGLINLTGDLTASSNISASYFLGDGSQLKNIVATADVNVDNSTAATNFQLVGVAASGDSATLITDDSQQFTFNPSSKLVRLPGTCSLYADEAAMNFGADQDVSLTHVQDTGLLLNSTMQMQFGDSGTNIAQSADGTLKLTSDGTLEMSVGAAGAKITGTTPKLTIGDGDEEDTTLLFDGNAKDFYIALDDSADDLLIGLGSAVGTTPVLGMDEDLKSTFHGDVTIQGTTPVLTIGDGDEEDTAVVFNGAAKDFYIALDDSADDLLIGIGSTVGTTPALAIDEDENVTLGNANDNQTTINGAMKLSIFNGSDTTDQSTLRSYCTSSSDFDYGRTDAECVAQPSMQWNGQVLYVRQAYAGEASSTSGSSANAFFNNADKWYFCESGSWYPSPFNT